MWRKTKLVIWSLQSILQPTHKTHKNPNTTHQKQRFIPAGAGNSQCFYSSRLAQIAVYPRWRGELSHCLKISSRSIGLSPLARGTHVTRHWTAETTRFIPAGAGNSSSSLPNPSARYGLSPLARGTLLINRQILNHERFIPAGAGNSTHLPLSPGRGTVYPRWRGELSKHNLLLINDFLSQSQSTNFTVSHKQHIHYVKERLIH